MIFVAIGTQAPFNRLLRIVDQVVAQMEVDEEIVVQAFGLDFVPEHLTVFDYLSTEKFNDYLIKSRLIVSHAGMGNIISALQFSKPIIILPRLSSLKEHRNDHQFATAKRMDSLNYVNVAYNDSELRQLLVDFFNGLTLKVAPPLGDSASESLLSSIETFIYKGT